MTIGSSVPLTGKLPAARTLAQPNVFHVPFVIAALSLLFLSVVVPNSLPIPTAAALVACFLLALPGFRIVSGVRVATAFYLASAIVTILYVAVGLSRGATLIAAAEVTTVYVASPILWIIVASALCLTVGQDRLIGWFVWLSLLCCISVAVYFSLYRTGGAAAVSFFVKSGNVDLTSGYSGAVMHVYGSLIFLAGGFFSSPTLVRNRILRQVLLVSLLVCAISSGRAALILAVPLGFALGLLLTPRSQGRRRKLASVMKVIGVAISVAIAAAAAVYMLDRLTSIQLGVIIETFADKILAGGGIDRNFQAHALLRGIFESNGLGAGHGVGVAYIRDPTHPWRYELVWLATVFRVGILGACVYAAVFVYYIVAVIKSAARGQLSAGSRFMFCGFIAAFAASSVDPYIEAFAFQWMYVIPVVDFLISYKIRQSNQSKPRVAQEPRFGYLIHQP